MPGHPAIHKDRADTLLAMSRFTEALAGYDAALKLGSNDPTAFRNRGAALVELGRDPDALACFDRSIQLAPASVPAHLLRAKLLIRLGRGADALVSLDKAAPLAPEDFEVHFHRGVALATLERHEESLAAFERALQLDASSVEALNNRGVELGQMLRPQESLESFVEALRLAPDHLAAHVNAGNTHKSLGDLASASRDFELALQVAPDDVMARWSKALLDLTVGNFEAGWPLYEARFELAHVRDAQRTFPVPRWTGEQPLEGKTILVHAEQGLGDTVQFCRYVLELEARGATVLFEAQAVLAPLLGTLPMHGQRIAYGEPLPWFDLHCPLLSLPEAFGTRLDTIPGHVPYLLADAEAIRAWRTRLESIPGLKVGLHWQGNPDTEKQPWVRGRSFPLAAAAALGSLADVSWISVQRGAGAQQRAETEFGQRILQLIDPQDLSATAVLETAALVSALDLVITSDTFLAHLCGALGVRVWTCVQLVPDWRWLLGRDDNPWYPAMRLFRQKHTGDWRELFEELAGQLAAYRDERLRT
jgi:tetratricopeptide (TPR) repeat protein